MQIGNSIKSIRLSMGLSQKDLCEGICSQGMLSLIEQNKHVPNATLLSKICLKLNIQMDELQQNWDSELIIKSQIREKLANLFYSRKYEEINNILNTSELHANFYTKLDKQLIIFYKAVYLGFIKKEFESSFELLEKSLHLTYFSNKRNYSYQEMLIMCNLGIVLIELGLNQEAFIYFNKLMEDIETNMQVKSEPKLTLIYLNISNAYSKINNHKESLRIVNKGIKWANKVSINTQYRLAYLYYEKAFNEQKLGLKNYVTSYKMAYYLALNKQDELLMKYIQSKIQL
ncbi:helix-turn-helix domain-containing protein [Lysinibacillus xylanilyticus]|uniref:helix-turn-helix domain-containing protein n=1 Tax=Lysinibacillus xylanilyticus TaxID=582475 RepID=UPI0038309F49